MIELKFATTFASITSFPTTQLPDFTLITGPNGAGKTHLLRAIHEGAVQTNVSPGQSRQNQSQARYFDWATMVPQDAQPFASETIRSERQQLLIKLNALKQENPTWLEPPRTILRDRGFAPEYLADPGLALHLGDDALASLVGIGNVFVLRKELENSYARADQRISSRLSESERREVIALGELHKIPIGALTEKDLLSGSIPAWGQSELFQQSFGRLFVAYRDLQLSNSLAELRATKEDSSSPYLTSEEFLSLHGPAPWDFVNQSLSDAGLDFTINQPEPFTYSSFTPKLTKISNGIEIPFGSLSSGEKILMSFAFCVYYANDRRQLSVQPTALLLDEIDAPLHPSMSKNIMSTIVNTLVESFGIKIIASTHSPSTVALAPDDSIYTMMPGIPGVQKSSKASALNILTFGVPTLSLSYDGRRQVFVESPADARTYDALYKLMKPYLDSERSLEFVATGTKSASGGDANTGCDVVKRLVSELTAAGNMSVFGLLDWDGKHKSSERILVLAEDTKNGVENVLFDPLLIALTICRSAPQEKPRLGIDPALSYLQICALRPEEMQGIASKVAELVFKGAPASTVPTRYVGGLELQIDERYFRTDDHALEEMILSAFPSLRAISKNQAGKLLEYVISNVIADSPALMPLDIRVLMLELLERPAHV